VVAKGGAEHRRELGEVVEVVIRPVVEELAGGEFAGFLVAAGAIEA